MDLKLRPFTTDVVKLITQCPSRNCHIQFNFTDSPDSEI